MGFRRWQPRVALAWDRRPAQGQRDRIVWGGDASAALGATQGLQLPPGTVDSLYSDINGERYRSEEWGFVAIDSCLSAEFHVVVARGREPTRVVLERVQWSRIRREMIEIDQMDLDHPVSMK